MHCGDACQHPDFQHVAEELQQYGRWRPYLHTLGEVEVKHGLELYLEDTDEVGNPQLPDED